MKMTLLALALAVATLGCAYHEPFRPRHAALDVGARDLRCDDVHAAYVQRASFERDPVATRRSAPVAVWGCGRVLRYVCSDYGARHGRCVVDPAYQTPAADEPQALVKIRTSYENAEGITQRETIAIGDAVVVRTPNSLGRALALPVRAGPARWRLHSAPVHERTVTHVGSTQTSVYTYTTTTRHTSQGCGRDFSLDVTAGAVYRLELAYHGPNQCEVRCAEEVETPNGTVLLECAGLRAL